MTLSDTHCFCGSGWYDQLWEGILGRPVDVEVLQSILKGDDCCTFAIHLPGNDGALVRDGPGRLVETRVGYEGKRGLVGSCPLTPRWTKCPATWSRLPRIGSPGEAIVRVR